MGNGRDLTIVKPKGVAVHAVLLGRPIVESGVVSPRPLFDLARLSDRSAIRRIGLGDHQGNYLETYTALGYIASITHRVEIGPYVTNTVGRDLGVHAAALASLDAMANGRVYCVLGRGDGAVRNLDIKESSVRDARDAVRSIRELLASGVAVHESGRRISLRWPAYPIDVPLYLAASGPRMTEVAFKYADGLYTARGLLPEDVQRLTSHGRVRRGACRQREFDLWWVTRFGLAETRPEALGLVREGLSSIGNHALRGSDHETLGIPSELRGPLKEYHRRYDWSQKSMPDSGSSNADLMVDLGLEEYFLQRFGIVGTPDEVVDRIRELVSRGVDKIVINIHTQRELDLFIDQVEPRL